MIDFGCKNFILDDIIKCGLGLTRAEFKIMGHFLTNIHKECTTDVISNELNLNLTTVQKGAKKLTEKGIIQRKQKNLPNGGYVYTYESKTKKEIRNILKDIIRNWTEKFEENIDEW